MYIIVKSRNCQGGWEGLKSGMCGKEAPFFSIIVPIYNNENDLEKCIASILVQSCRDFELILVDDGSVDHSLTICKSFARQDERVYVIHRKENGGAALARNEGLAHASGKYIYHVDGDDWIAENLLEKAKQRLKGENPPDIFVFCYVKVQEDGRYEKRELKVEEGVYDKARLKKEIYPSMLCKVGREILGGIDSGSLCDKVIKRELLEKHQCRNTSLFRGEDSVCAWECMYFADKIYFSGSAMYFYNRLSASSGQKKYHVDLYENDKAVVEYLRRYLGTRENKLFERQINAMEFRGVVRAIYQEISFRHSIYSATRLLKAKCKGKGKICSGKGLPLKDQPYILLLNLHCFIFLFFCVTCKMTIDKIVAI